MLIGWDKEQQVVKLPLFKRFRERADMPLCIFKAALQVSLPCTLQPERPSWILTSAMNVSSLIVLTCTCRRMPGVGSGQGCIVQLRMLTLIWD